MAFWKPGISSHQILTSIMISKKLLLITIGIFLWSAIGGGIWYYSQVSNTQPVKDVLGANDSKLSAPTKPFEQPKQQVLQQPSASISKLSSTKQESSVSTPSQPSIALVGNGCLQDSTFGSQCQIQTSENSYTLKSCKEESLKQCNFYGFELGQRNSNTQYILQKYEENGDILVDILGYSVNQNTLSTVKTVLFQSVNDGSSEAKNGNVEYLNTLGQYR
jgi:hypothetical protein